MSTALADRRTGIERRRTANFPFSRYWLVGKRKRGRRVGEAGNVYVDRYTSNEWLLVIGVLVLSISDLIFTLIDINIGGNEAEANPLMAMTLGLVGTGGFGIVKLVATVVGLLVLLVHVRFRHVKRLLSGALLIYIAVVIFHIYLGLIQLGLTS